MRIAEELGRPRFVVDAFDSGLGRRCGAWLEGAAEGLVLNVGGRRESEVLGTYEVAQAVLMAALAEEAQR